MTSLRRTLLVIILVAAPFSARAAAMAAPGSTTSVVVQAQRQPDAYPAEDTPWGFFRENVRHANSVGKIAALIFFTILFAGLYAALYLPYIVAAIAVLALLSARVRASWLLRAGLVIYIVGFAALRIAGRFDDNPLGFGFLYSFTSPVGALLAIAGAARALLKTDRAARRAVAALAAAADARRPAWPIWPDHPPLPEIDAVVREGARASRTLVALLGSEDGAQGPSIHVEQQAELALCRIYGVAPETAKTVSDAHVSRAENRSVREFWRAKADRG